MRKIYSLLQKNFFIKEIIYIMEKNYLQVACQKYYLQNDFTFSTYSFSKQRQTPQLETLMLPQSRIADFLRLTSFQLDRELVCTQSGVRLILKKKV
jgi:hypothetical protein